MDCNYKGRRRPSHQSYALVFDSDQQHFTLESIESQYMFNMTSAPWEREPAKIAQLYSQLDWQDKRETSPAVSVSSVEEELFGEDFDEPDTSNPFDYRHYLGGLPSASPAPQSVSRAPTPQDSTPSTTATTAPPRISNGPLNKTGKRNVATPSKQHLTKQHAIPTIQMQRRASVKTSQPLGSDADDDDDNDGLIIEQDPDEQPAKRRHLEITRSPGGGPRSLRSAANSASPASHIANPAASVHGGREAGSGSEEDGEDGDEEDDEDVDVDVDHFKLGSPAVGQVAEEEEEEEEDGEDDEGGRRQSLDPKEQAELQATLEQAFGEENFEVARAEEARRRKAEESESESEEE